MKIYIIISIIYGVYSIMRHVQLYPNHISRFRLVSIFVLNVLLFPLSLIFALAMHKLIPTKEDHKRFLKFLGFNG